MSVRLVIAARAGENLKRSILDAVRAGDLRTFEAYERGKKLRHKQRATHPGYIRLDWRPPVLVADVRDPKGRESMLLAAFVGRLHARFADQIESVTLQFRGAR